MSRRSWIVTGLVIGLVVVGLVIAAAVFFDAGDLARVGDFRGGRGGFRFGGMMLIGGLVRLLLWAAQIGLTALIAAWIVRRWMGTPPIAAATAPTMASPSAPTMASPPPSQEENTTP